MAKAHAVTGRVDLTVCEVPARITSQPHRKFTSFEYGKIADV